MREDDLCMQHKQNLHELQEGGGGTLGGGDVVDGVFECAFGALALEMECSMWMPWSLWWLIMDEEDDEVVVNIWREFIGRE
ncbi:hypothetical protein Tco_0348512 [Tanacetum coccineum]